MIVTILHTEPKLQQNIIKKITESKKVSQDSNIRLQLCEIKTTSYRYDTVPK